MTTPNAVGRMLVLLGDEWSLLVIQQALLGATRYGDFTARLPISNAVLTGGLRALTEDLLLERVVYQTNPVRADYRVTPRSRSLWPVLVSIWAWERRWVPLHSGELPVLRHAECGAACEPELICQACAEVLFDKAIQVRWGPSGSWARSLPASANRRRPDTALRGGAAGLFPETMSVFGNRWAAAILIAAFLGSDRFSDFQRRLGAPPGSVAARLRLFRTNGILTEAGGYGLTEKGRALLPVLVLALQWSQRWFTSPEGDAVVLTHRVCGHPLTAVLACDQCAEPLTGDALVVAGEPEA